MLSFLKSFFMPVTQPAQNKERHLPPVLPVTIPELLYLPLCSEREQLLTPKVSVHQSVKQYDILADTADNNAPLHAPINGEIVDIIQRPNVFMANKEVETLVLKTINHAVITASMRQRLKPSIQSIQRQKQSAQEIENQHSRLEKSGLVGMGGAGFSTIEKIKLSYRENVHTVIVNLCECEPIISCDQALAEQYPEEILLGISTVVNSVQAQKAVIVVEDSKPVAIEKLQSCLVGCSFISLAIIPSVYPNGHEKQLVEYVSGNRVGDNQRPVDYGYVVFNVATCYAMGYACHYNAPLTQRLLTISDGNISLNQWVVIGTPIMDLLTQHRIAYDPQKHHLIMGGPMNGKAIASPLIGVSKNMNCLLVLPHQLPQTNRLDQSVHLSSTHSPCIRCGECVKVCPVDLLPQQLFWFAQAQQAEKAEQYHLFDCIECGNCAFVCPSNIPLITYYRRQKKQISEQKLEQFQIQKAKERFEKRNQRLEQTKQKHQEMLRQKRLQAQQKLAQKQADQVNSETTHSEKKPSQAVAIARAKALARKKQTENSSSTQ